jgi:glycosyltransferase involved in cell wall biosynthesis
MGENLAADASPPPFNEREAPGIPAIHAGRQRHLLLLITEDWYFWSHRRAIALGAQEAGFHVTLASRFAEHRGAVEETGITALPIRLRRSSRSPVEEARAVADLASHYRRVQPDIVHHVAIKPVLYGSWAARASGVRAVVNAISGLGYAFTAPGLKARSFGFLAQAAYRSALRRPGTHTIFQNEDDRSHFVDRGIAPSDRTTLIRGSGVDLDRFRPWPEPEGDPVILYAGRMLWSKGIGDLANASRLLREKGFRFRVVLVGHADVDNPEAISADQLRAWESEGLVEWWGRRSEMPEIMAGAHVVVLGSDREGVPKVLLEAAGAGKPLVATDVPGCRDVVEDGRNGFLVPRRDPRALADVLERLIEDRALRAQMGARSRQKAEEEFSEQQVVAETIALYEKVLRHP